MTKIVQSKTKYQQVVDYIKDGIARGIYKEGSLLPSERALIEGLGVGRVTVREGLRILSEERIIYTVKGKGSYVSISPKALCSDVEEQAYRRHFLESTQLRLLLEPSVVQEVALHASESDLQSIRDCLDPIGFLPEAFHLAIIKALHNDVLLELFAHLNDLENDPQLLDASALPIAEKKYFIALQEQHTRIFDAIVHRDGDAAFNHMRQHLEYIQKVYEDYFRDLCS